MVLTSNHPKTRCFTWMIRPRSTWLKWWSKLRFSHAFSTVCMMWMSWDPGSLRCFFFTNDKVRGGFSLEVFFCVQKKWVLNIYIYLYIILYIYIYIYVFIIYNKYIHITYCFKFTYSFHGSCQFTTLPKGGAEECSDLCALLGRRPGEHGNRCHWG